MQLRAVDELLEALNRADGNLHLPPIEFAPLKRLERGPRRKRRGEADVEVALGVVARRDLDALDLAKAGALVAHLLLERFALGRARKILRGCHVRAAKSTRAATCGRSRRSGRRRRAGTHGSQMADGATGESGNAAGETGGNSAGYNAVYGVHLTSLVPVVWLLDSYNIREQRRAAERKEAVGVLDAVQLGKGVLALGVDPQRDNRLVALLEHAAIAHERREKLGYLLLSQTNSYR